MGGRGYPEDLVLPAPGSDVRHHVTEPDDFADHLTHGEPDDVADPVAVPDGFSDDEADHPHQAEQAW